MRHLDCTSGKKGFTLVEIMIVTAVIGMLTAVAVPNVLRVRQNSNDSAIKGDLHTFSAAIESYRAASPNLQFPVDLSGLTGGTYPYLDDTWIEGATKKGHTVSYLTDTSAYSLFATPIPGQSTLGFCVDNSGVIYQGGVGAATGCSGGTPTGG